MSICRSCSHEVPGSASFCPSCGEPMAVADAPTFDRSEAGDDATLHKPAGSPPSRPISHSSDSFPHGRFLPGMMIGGRYRIVSMLGRGGMGEVYRADDLSVGQQVALKFLPSELAADSERLERFRQEVRLARQVSHPNVCRVYDIGEIEGEHFISMEYIEGEDLGHLLRRIGQLPEAKAIQIARQIAAGLAAAHDRNLVHRDLKPANIMLDERGMVRITDFGLAATTEELAGGAAREGTPQYMAPEQLEGGAVTVRSDIYSLGLVLFELFTGKRAFEAGTMSELMEMRQSGDLGSLSDSLSGINPAVERIILRCVSRDPSNRPQSALAVSAALPGGDPLAAALAAGETPSPEMVAAAGDEGALALRPAVILLVLALIGLAGLPFLTRWSGASLPLTLEHGPQVMKAKAREMLERLGFEETPADVAYGYFHMGSWLEHIEETDQSSDRWAGLQERAHPLFGFWYRESPEPLISTVYFTGIAGGTVSLGTPHPTHSGEVRITVDDRGNLWSLSAVPPRLDADVSGITDPFGSLLREAGLAGQEVRSVDPLWTPQSYATDRRGWQYEIEPDVEARVEAAVLGAQPVYFTRVFPWTEEPRLRPTARTTSETVVASIQIALFFIVIGSAGLLARRNIRMGRGDRRGAFRLAMFNLGLILVLWVLDADHVASFGEFGLLVIALSWGLFFASLFWLMYMALEPFIRRRWPDMLISWSRLISGKFKDSLVGRDLLIGGAAGIFINWMLPHGLFLAHRLAGNPPPRPRFFNLQVLEGPVPTIVSIFSYFSGAIAAAFFATFLLFLLLVLVRREWIAALGVVAIGAVIGTAGLGSDWIAAVIGAAVWALLVFILVRFGMLAAIISLFTANAVGIATAIPQGFGPMTAWPLMISLGLGLVLVVTGFFLAIGNRPLFGENFLDA